MPRFGMQSKDEIEISSRAGARAVYLGNHTMICRVLDTYLLYLDTRDYGIVPHLAMDGFWESWVTLAMARLVRPGMRVVNVGANFGYYAVLFADLVGPTGDVVAFEPLGQIATQLERTKVANGFKHLHVRREVVLEKPGTVTFANPVGYLNGFVLRAGEVTHQDVTIEHIPGAPLDGMVGSVDFLFVDAEGVEPEVLRGARGALAKSPAATVVLEFTRSRYPDPLAFALELEDGGRRALYVVGEMGELVPRTPEQLVAGDAAGIPGHWVENPTVVARVP